MHNKGFILRIAVILAAALATISVARAQIKLGLPGQYADQITSLFSQHHWSKGKDLLDEGLDKWPGDPNLNYLAGRYWWNAKNYDKARYHLVKACQKNYNHVDAKQLLIQLEETTGNFSSAICYINELLEVNPYSKNLWIKKVDLYKKLGNFEEANNLLKRLNVIYANDAYVSGEFYSVLENTLTQARRNGDMQQQEETLSEIVRINPTDIDYQLMYANLLIQEGRLNDALDNLTAAVNANPGNIDIIRKNCDILMATGRNMGALALVRNQMEMNPQSQELRELYQRLMLASAEMEREADAYQMYTRVYARKGDMESLSYLLKESRRRGYFDDHLLYIGEMRKKTGDRPALVMQEYETYSLMGRSADADKVILEAVKKYPSNYDINISACRIYLKEATASMLEERYKDAIEPLKFIQRYCVEEDMKANAVRRLYTCYKQMNNLQDAEQMLRERLRYDPVYTINIERAGLYAEKGRTDDALDILYRAYIATPADSVSQRAVLGSAYSEYAIPYLKQCNEDGATPEVINICDVLLQMNPKDYWGLRYAAGAAKDPSPYIDAGYAAYPYDVFFRTRKARQMAKDKHKYEEAIGLMEPLLQEFPGDDGVKAFFGEISLAYADTLRKQAEYVHAGAVLDSALAITPKDKDLRFTRGLVYEKMKMWDSAYVYQAAYEPSFLEQREFLAKMDALKSRSWNNSVDAGCDVLRFGDADRIVAVATVGYSRKYKNNVFSLQIGYTGRDPDWDDDQQQYASYGGRGLQTMLTWEREFENKWSFKLSGAIADRYFPSYMADINLTRHFENSFDVEMGALFRKIPAGDKMAGATAGASKTWSHIYLGGKATVGTLSSLIFVNGSVRMRFYPTVGGRTYVESQFGAGTAPELSFLNYYFKTRAYEHMNSFVSATWHQMLTSNLEFNISATWNTLYNQSTNVKYRNLFIAHAGFTIAF